MKHFSDSLMECIFLLLPSCVYSYLIYTEEDLQYLALEGTRAALIPTCPSTCSASVGEHLLFICRALIAFKISIGKIAPLSANSQEVLTSEKVRRRKTSLLSGSIEAPVTFGFHAKIHLACVHALSWWEYCLFDCLFQYQAQQCTHSAQSTCWHKHFSFFSFINEINRRRYHPHSVTAHLSQQKEAKEQLVSPASTNDLTCFLTNARIHSQLKQ